MCSVGLKERPAARAEASNEMETETRKLIYPIALVQSRKVTLRNKVSHAADLVKLRATDTLHMHGLPFISCCRPKIPTLALTAHFSPANTYNMLRIYLNVSIYGNNSVHRVTIHVSSF